MEPFDGLIVDLDGVVWLGYQPIRGSIEALRELRRRGTRIVFLTNDPRGGRVSYARRLRELGVELRDEDVVTSASALAAVLRRDEPASRAFVVGSEALREEVEAAGLEPAGDDAEVVVVGGHARFDYAELFTATRALRSGARLYATGRDAIFPMPDGPWPGTGAILAAVETAGGVTATVVGKPEPAIFEHARSLLDGCEQVAIVGDNLDSDIAGGGRAGLRTVLVLTGMTRETDLGPARPQPDAVLPDLAALAGEY